MEAEGFWVLLIFPGFLVFLAVLFFLGEPVRIQQRAALPLLALTLASGVFVGLVIYVRNRATLPAQLRVLSAAAFFVSIGLIIDSVRYRDWKDGGMAVLMLAAGLLIGATGDPDLNLIGGVISAGTGLWGIIKPPRRVLSRTVGNLPEALWHLAKTVLMFVVFMADVALVGRHIF